MYLDKMIYFLGEIRQVKEKDKKIKYMNKFILKNDFNDEVI